MPDTKISALAALTTLASLDELPIVDKSDTSMGASGTTKRVTLGAVMGPGCRLTVAAGQSITTATWTSVALDTETYDPAGMHDNVTNNTRVTVTQDGIYLVVGAAIIAADASGTLRLMRFLVDGATQLGDAPGPVSAGASRVAGSQMTRLTAGQYVEMQVYQNATGSLTLAVPITFSVQRVGTYV